MARIAIEATGCDEGFSACFKGARNALEKDKSLELTLVAGKDGLPKVFHGLHQLDRIRLETTESTFKPKEGETTLPKKVDKTTSIYRALDMHKAGDVDAVIAPGDTGATAVYSFLMLDRIRKLRPAIAVNFAGNILIDAGANLKSQSKHYFQHAIMGHVLSEFYLGIKDPLIGIITMGPEAWKGDDVAKESKPLIEGLREKGYRVSKDFFEQNCFREPGIGFKTGLVGVTNSEIGNTLIKAAEAGFEISEDLMRHEFNDLPWYLQILGWLPLSKMKKGLKEKLDYRSFAVAPLIGYEGNVMIGHGRSDAEAIESAIGITSDYLKKNINEHLREEVEKVL